MSLDCVRECADLAQRDPCVQELRTTQLTIRTFRWAGGRLGVPPKQLVTELVLPKYEVQQVKAREIASSGGRLMDGDVRVFGIVPSYTKSDGVTTGGYAAEQLDPQKAWTQLGYGAPVQDREVEYVLTGDVAGIYRLVNVDSDDPVLWNLILRNTRKSP